jgi:hypothetical protein
MLEQSKSRYQSVAAPPKKAGANGLLSGAAGDPTANTHKRMPGSLNPMPSISAESMPSASQTSSTRTTAQRAIPDVTVRAAAPKTREYKGFDLNRDYQRDAENFKVSDDALVENRLTGLLSKDSDYLKRAKANGVKLANRRGLLNSSIASGASTAAAIDAALPIAQQDAGTFAQSDLSKQTFLNNRAITDQTAYNNSRLSAQEATQRSGEIRQNFEGTEALNRQAAQQQANLADQSFGHQSSLSKQQFEQQSALSDQTFIQQKTLQEMDEASRAQLLEAQSKHNMLLQQSQSASNRFQDLAQQIAAINTSPDMKPEQKTAAIEQLFQLQSLSMQTQSELMKAAGIADVSIGGGTGGAGFPIGGGQSLPTSPNDESLQFDPASYDKHNHDALKTRMDQLSSIANKLEPTSPEGRAARISLVEAQIRELEIQYHNTSSKNKHRQIAGRIKERKADLAKLQEATPQQAAAPQQSNSYASSDEILARVSKQEEQDAKVRAAAKTVSKTMRMY